MGSDLRTRGLERSDLGRLLELYRQLHPEDPTLTPQDAESKWRALSAFPGSIILVGLVDDIVVASCTLVVIPNLTRGGSPYALIENVVTDAGYRRRGFGRAVLEAALSAAWRAGCYKVMLMTERKDPGTLAFYAAAGFKQSKTGYQARRLETPRS